MAVGDGIFINCPTCGRRLRAPVEKIGRTLKCPGCGAPVFVTEGETIRSSDSKGANDAQQPPPPPRRSSVIPMTPVEGNTVSATAIKRGFVARIIYLFDPMFERYLTPWIIRATWILAAAASLVSLLLYLCVQGYFVASVKVPISEEVMRAEFNLEMARAELQASQWGTESDEKRPPPESTEENIETETEPAFDLKEELRRRREKEIDDRMADRRKDLETPADRVRQAEAKLADAKAAQPSWFSLAMQRTPIAVLSCILGAISIVLTLLWIRVLCEVVVVLFNIANRLTSIDHRLHDTA